jgi:hypothetical protein
VGPELNRLALDVKDADALGRKVADLLCRQLPEAGSFT